nr:immunoglobulin heavy chain junction region [Mus musculus]
CARQGYFDVW